MGLTKVQPEMLTAAKVVAIATSNPGTMNNTSPDIVYEIVEKDPYSLYNNATGEITIDEDGDYLFGGSYESDGSGTLVSTNNLSALALKINGTIVKDLAKQRVNAGGVLILGSSGTCLVPLAFGDVITIGGYSDNATTLATGNAGANFIHMHLVK